MLNVRFSSTSNLGGLAVITEMDNLREKNTFEFIDQSSLEAHVKAELKESVAESKRNLNGRTTEERLMSIARNQFDMIRFISDIIIQFKNVTDELKKPKESKRTWKDVVAEMNWWPLTVLGSVIAVCCIFSENIVQLVKIIVELF